MSELVAFRPPDAAAQLVAWADAARAASVLASSLVTTNVCPPAWRGKPQEATAVVLLGAELGLSPITSLRSMYELRGQIGMYVRAQVALVQSRGHRIWTVHESDDSVEVAGHRAGDPEHVEVVVWTIARARQAGFIRRGQRGELSQYESQPRTMLWSRAAGDVARRIAADVLAGIPEIDDPLPGPQAGTGSPAAPARVLARAPRAPEPVAELVDSTGRDTPAAGDPTPTDAPEPVEPPDTVTPPPPPDELDVEPAQDVEPSITSAQLVKLQTVLVQARVRGSDARHAWLTDLLGRQIDDTRDLTVTEASAAIDAAEALVEP